MAFQYPGFQLNAFQIKRRGSADCLLPPLTCEAEAAHGVSVVGDCTLPPISCEADAFHGYEAAGDCLLPPISCEATAAHGVNAEGDCTLPPITCEATDGALTGDGDCTLPPITCEASGSQVVGNADCTLPTLSCEAHIAVPAEQRHGGGHVFETYPEFLKRRAWEEEQFRLRMHGPNRADCLLPPITCHAEMSHLQGVDAEAQERPGLADQGRHLGPLEPAKRHPLPSPAPSGRPILADVQGVAGQGAAIIPLITLDSRAKHERLSPDEIEAALAAWEHAA